jgi:hypothetical protein
MLYAHEVVFFNKVHYYLSKKKSQRYRKYKLTLQPVNIIIHPLNLDKIFFSIVVVNKKFQT